VPARRGETLLRRATGALALVKPDQASTASKAAERLTSLYQARQILTVLYHAQHRRCVKETPYVVVHRVI